MRIGNISGLRSSIGAVAAVVLTGLTVWLFESPYTAWGSRATPPIEVAIQATPAVDATVFVA